MRTEVNKYRGFSITFDTDTQSFDAYSDTYDRAEIKKSYSSVLSWIDEFIKENEVFIPFNIVPRSGALVHEPLKVVGIRKDGGVIVEDSAGEKKKLSIYKEVDYVIPNDDMKPVLAEIERMDEEIESLRKQRSLYTKNNLVEDTLYSKLVEMGLRKPKDKS